MNLTDSTTKPSIYAERAYALILAGVTACDSARDQRLLLDSLVCQCAAFTRLLCGEQQFFDLLERLKYIDFSVPEGVLPARSH
ncbi:hypothetical protein AVKW3434_22050 [Acidovorax sp. SUPP3434]|uniref:hypothetical protein n=1 Tax=Acidovorax sp. SUPP3434 TaxID=2920880 RepID=UPI0023DE2A5F|nr:hypothetical protein [Acidovorax sp. SUPP3434]GKT02121.1 hypothetical protein AVKW3434_22050 [Acidovorax sp. SUPP3434]